MHGNKSIVTVYIAYRPPTLSPHPAPRPKSPSESLDQIDQLSSFQLRYCSSYIPDFIVHFMTVMDEHLQVGIRKEGSRIGGSQFLKQDSRMDQEWGPILGHTVSQPRSGVPWRRTSVESWVM